MSVERGKEGFGRETPLNAFESLVYDGYQELSDKDTGVVPSNKDIRDFLSDYYGFETTRRRVSEARKKIVEKLGFKKGW